MKRNLLIVSIVVLALAAAGLVWANACNNLDDCVRAAKEYCEQIHDSQATGAVVNLTADECDMYCADGSSATLSCSISGP